MAGAMLIILGLAKFGGMIKFIPYPVTTGFTAGIALIIFTSQVKEIFGMHTGKLPRDFIEVWTVYVHRFVHHDVNWFAFAIAAATLAIIILVRRLAPRLP